MAKRKKSLENYIEVKDRLKLYQGDYPDFRVYTDVVWISGEGNSVIVKAFLYKSPEEQERGLAHSTGIAQELEGAGFVNETSFVENCETSAIGRALANVNYSGSDQRPSREEMEKVQRTKEFKSEEKEPPKKEVKKDGSIEEVIDSFKTTDQLTEWFNSELDNRKGSDKNEFRDTYLPLVRAKVEELYED